MELSLIFLSNTSQNYKRMHSRQWVPEFHFLQFGKMGSQPRRDASQEKWLGVLKNNPSKD